MPVSASTQTLANYLATGYWHETGQTPHSFDTSVSNIISVNLTALTSAGQALARAALDAWEAVADISFREVTSGGRISFDDNQAGAFSTARYYSSGDTHSAHVNVSTSWLSSYSTGVGGYSFQTYVHEIGHALGLGHSGVYNGSASYETDAKFANDCWQQTVMSYFCQDENTAVDASYAQVVTPMMADILAIQQLYGSAKTGPTAGNTTYGLGSNLGTYMDGVFGAGAGHLTRNALTIYDAGGVDTINFSDDTRAQQVDLNAGAFSSVYGLRGNLGIALGTTVEHYVAGSGSDRVTGNATANSLKGVAGNDTLRGMAGNDRLLGGAGNDTLDGGLGTDRLEGGTGNDTYILAALGDTVVEGSGAGADVVKAAYSYALGSNLESLILTGTSAINGTGNGLANRISGNGANNVLKGADGNDVLAGADGNDTLVGGNGTDKLVGGNGADKLVGGAGADKLIGSGGSDDFVFLSASDSTTAARDVITDFAKGYDDIHVATLDANTGLSGNQAFALDINGSFSAGEIRQTVSSSGLLVEFNTDADSEAEMAILIQGLTSSLAATDFVL